MRRLRGEPGKVHDSPGLVYLLVSQPSLSYFIKQKALVYVVFPLLDGIVPNLNCCP